MLKFFSNMTSEVKYELLGVLLFTIGALALISLVGLNAGPVGQFIAKVQQYALGVGAPVLPLCLIALGSRYIWTRLGFTFSFKIFGFALLYILLLAIYHYFTIPVGQEILPDSLRPGGGIVGGMTLFAMRKLFGVDGSVIVLASLFLCTVILTTTWSLHKTIRLAREKVVYNLQHVRETLAASKEQEQSAEQEQLVTVFQSPGASPVPFYDQEKETVCSSSIVMADSALVVEADSSGHNTDRSIQPSDRSMQPAVRKYVLPPLSLLRAVGKPKAVKVSQEITDNGQILLQTLESFGVKAKIVNTCQGPAVTRYELEPAPGIKVSKIVGLSDDIALKLAATGIRIEAPIPGKAAVGIEVPNRNVSGVHLREVLESEEFKKAVSRLTVALGRDLAGQPITADLAKMPHMLVAGATGSGKSVCINTLITSVLFRATPEEVKFILVDPKVVELSNYNGIPHLMTPVVTDAKKAAAALNWAVQEMERRYAVFATAGVRDIGRYNEIVGSDGALPLIVIIIDELADLMMAAPVDVENAICRLAQKARAAGLHLVLATQRPSVDVITGTIKANVPSRISFAVSSQIDSRTILDMAGAEKLLGKGDMLFYPVGIAKPLRVQGAFISDSEVEDLLVYIKRQAEPEYTDGITSCESSSDKETNEPEPFEDELLEEAIQMVMETGQASTSMLQRRFRIGYTRAGRLIDTMEAMKIVGPNIGSKPRDILMTFEQVRQRYFKP